MDDGQLHPRLCVSGVCTFSWSLDDTVAFWQRHQIRRVGIPFPTLRAAGLDRATDLISGADLEIVDVIDLSPFRLHEPDGGPPPVGPSRSSSRWRRNSGPPRWC